MKEEIRRVVQMFCYASTGTTIGTATWLTIFMPDRKIASIVLWQIIGIALAISCLNFIFISKHELNKRAWLIRTCIHYLCTNIVLMGSAIGFKWINIYKIGEILGFVLIVFVIYILVLLGIWLNDMKTSKKMNEAIAKYHQKKQE